jgi:hypothetical protein
VLIEAVPTRAHLDGRVSEVSPLSVDGALLLSGGLTSKVVEIGALGRGLVVRAPSLPVTVSPTDRFQSVSLKIIVRDCHAAARWTPADRPFIIRWRDEYGNSHLDRAGDFGEPVAISLVRYIDAVCDSQHDR